MAYFRTGMSVLVKALRMMVVANVASEREADLGVSNHRY
jgi:hypothetical protein